MKSILNALLSDKPGGEVFTCFSVWHFLYMIPVFAIAVAIVLILRKKSDGIKRKAIRISIFVAFALYVADFFIMPLSQGEINIEKLPFHICTATCTLCFLSHHSKLLRRFRHQFALIGLISNFIYLMYPAGVGWFMIHPLSYRVAQTLIFHGVMTIHGILVVCFEKVLPSKKEILKDLGFCTVLVIWALIGNYSYNGVYNGEERFFNWFFVVQDPFGMIPMNISRFIMPILNLTIFFTVALLIRTVSRLVIRSRQKKSLT